MRRRWRGSCINRVGKERFAFDKKVELLKYKYLCCDSMTRMEWRKREELPYSYYEWKKEIWSKYDKYNAKQLEEFKRYLVLCSRRENIFRESNSIIYAALAASTITIILDSIIKATTLDEILVVNGLRYIIMWVCVFFLMIYIVNAILAPLKRLT